MTEGKNPPHRSPAEQLREWADRHSVQAQEEWIRYQSGPATHRDLAKAHERAAAALYREAEGKNEGFPGGV
jgi:hypothetical protein